MGDCMLTTYDNPFDPFSKFEEWFKFDMSKGYNTCGYLAHMAHTSLNLSAERNEEEVQRAIDEIVDLEPMIYRKISRNSDGVGNINANLTTKT